jgi:hypothetical protein
MGINAATINAKLNGKADWNLSEIEKACGLLRVPADEINEYFFY